MNAQVVAASPPYTTMPTTASFEAELQQQLKDRTLLILAIGLVVSIVMTVVALFIAPQTPATTGGLAAWRGAIRIAHIASFGLAFIAVYFLKLSVYRLQWLAVSVFGVNLVLAIAALAFVSPDQRPTLAVALVLFIYAAFIPSRAIYPAALGAIALLSFTVVHVANYLTLPEVQTFWSQRGGTMAFRGFLIWGLVEIMILTVVAYLTSRTLYSLRKTAHEAERLGNYLIEKQLGKGGMGQVFLARHALIRRPTAVKVMQAPEGEEASMVARFEREVQLSATLTHPNNITIFDFGHTHDDQFYYAMEFLEGMDLQKLVERHGPMPATRTVFILVQACGALAEAHGREIVHRDIKPSNIFLTQRGGLCDFVKVLDFGLAKQLTADPAVALTKTGVIFGTPRYISPEAVRGATVDARADLYCLGAVAYWMLTARPPFISSSNIEVLLDHLNATPPPPSQGVELPIAQELEDIVMRCLEKRPADRFQSAAELEAALRAIHFDEPWTQEQARESWALHGLATTPPAEPDERRPGQLATTKRGISQFFFEP